MPLDVVEFKKRFGKKALDTVTPEQRYQAALAKNGPKLVAARLKSIPPIESVDRELSAAVKNKHWSLAADLLDEAAGQFNLDQGLADKLRRDLAQQAGRAQLDGALTPTLVAPHDAILAEIKADNYDDARDQLKAFKDAVDAFAGDLRGLQARLQALTDAAKVTSFKLRSQPGDGPAKASSFESDLAAATQDLAQHRIALAAPKLDSLERTVRNLEPADKSPAALKRAFEAARAAPLFPLVLPLAGSTEAAFGGLGAEAAKVAADLGLADTAAQDGDYAKALQLVDAAGGAANDIRQRLLAISPTLQVSGNMRMSVTLAISAGTVPASIPKSDLDTLLAEDKKRQTAHVAGDTVTVIRKLVLLKPLYEKIAAALDPAAAAAKVAEAGRGNPLTSPKAAEYQALLAAPDLKKLATALNAPDADLKAFRQMDGAAKLLDDMVGAMGGTANTDDKRQFVRGAMKARFGLNEVTGGTDGKGLSTKALPRLYSLFGMLPPDHTTNNDSILSVDRQKQDDTSWHASATKAIVLKAGTTGRKGASFDDTTLHEIAHGVDLKFGFMNANGGGQKFGGWRDETYDSVRKVAMDDLGLVKDFPTVPRALLTQYIDLVFGGANPASLQQQFDAAKGGGDLAAEFKAHKAVTAADAGRAAAKNDSDVQRDLSTRCKKLVKEKEPKRSMLNMVVEAVAYNRDPDTAIADVLSKLATTATLPDDKTWAALAVHPAIDFASSIRLKNGSNGLWDEGDSGAARCAVGGRVYQEAYAGNWVSYLQGARATRLVNYQFRHKMEWFAECYSAFFRGKLPLSHPLSAWLQQQKDAAAPAP